MPDNNTDQGRAFMLKMVNWAFLPISHSLLLNPFLPRPGKTALTNIPHEHVPKSHVNTCDYMCDHM